MNLLKETIKKLEDNGKFQADVLWCGSDTFGWFMWGEFIAIADVEYDPGFGGAEVAVDLLVVGKDFWLERHEYDGSEWWEFKTLPVRPAEYRKADKVICGSWQKNLKEIHDGEEYD